MRWIIWLIWAYCLWASAWNVRASLEHRSAMRLHRDSIERMEHANAQGLYYTYDQHAAMLKSIDANQRLATMHGKRARRYLRIALRPWLLYTERHL